MNRFIVEKREGCTVFFMADKIEINEGVLCAYEGHDLVGVYREYIACWMTHKNIEPEVDK